MTPFHPNPRHPSLELRPRCRSRIWSRCGPTALETRVHRIARERPHRRNSIPHTNRFRSWPDRHRFAIDYPRGPESDDPLGRGSSFDPSTFPVSASGTIAARPRSWRHWGYIDRTDPMRIGDHSDFRNWTGEESKPGSRQTPLDPGPTGFDFCNEQWPTPNDDP